MNPETSPPPSPTANPDPLTPPPKNKRTKLFVAIGAAVIIIIFAIIGFVLVSGGADDPIDETKQSKQFQNWLKPTEEIKIGSQRYVSVCQALPRQTVESIFGQLSDQTVIQEDYLDRSVDESEREQRLACRYNPASNEDDALEVGLETEQYPDASEVKNIRFSFGSFDEEDVQAELDAYKDAVASSNNKDAKEFLQKLERSFSTYKQYSNERDDEKLAKLDTNSLVLPISDSISGAGGDFAFVGAYNNVVYTVYHTPKEDKSSKSVTEYPDDDLVNELTIMKRATEAIAGKLRNKSLDQSPAPTIPDGDTNTYGSTTVLEPCAIMTPTVFSEITSGRQQNHPVKRTTVSMNIADERRTKRDNQVILPSNECDRHAEDEAADTNTYAWLEISYAESAKQAEDLLAKSYKVDGGDQQLQTDADWALAFVDPGRPSEFLYIFRTGPYIVRPTIYSRGPGGEVEASRDQYLQAINKLTAEIKQAAQNAE